MKQSGPGSELWALLLECVHNRWLSAFVLDTCLNGEKFGNDDDNDNDNDNDVL